MPEICLWKTGRYCFVHCAGEDSSAIIGEDGIKKCKTGVSPFSPGKTMEEVSAGFSVAFPDIQLLDKDTELSNENNIQASEPDDDFVLFELLKPPKDASYEIPTL
ncbi:uncharacterized protein [Pocillopora verrucosa]|uniref:uncharacterized protein n=1 Tax=Pocillopora verrucosa TaxID=203993 RepID=UPI00333F5CFE